MAVLLQLLAFVLLAAWAAFTFGWPAALLAAAIELLVLSFVVIGAPQRRGDG